MRTKTGEMGKPTTIKLQPNESALIVNNQMDTTVYMHKQNANEPGSACNRFVALLGLMVEADDKEFWQFMVKKHAEYFEFKQSIKTTVH